MVKISVVILNWNGLNHLQTFIPKVLEYTQIEGVEIVVVDNGSSDISVQFIETFKDIRVICLDKNYGFADGYNKGLKMIDSEYFVLLNSDVEVTPNWLMPMINFLEENNEYAACQPKILSYTLRTSFEYAGACGGFIDALGFPFCRGRILNKVEEDHGQYDSIAQVFWASGACLVIKSNVFYECGELDGNLFAHMEEIDLCWRIQNRGYKIACFPQSTIYHVGGGTLPNNNPRKLFLNYRNNLLILFKNLPTRRIWYILFIRLILDGISAFIYLMKGSVSYFKAVFSAHIEFYKLIGKYKIERQRLKKHNNKTKLNTIYTRSIVFSFFVRKQKKYSSLKF